jgi:GNAT superfamily N-acetyltransferase
MTTSPVRTRYGAADDLEQVIALHDRCSADALHRRFHAPLTRVRSRLAGQLIAPEPGWSVVAEITDDVVGLASVGAVSAHEVEVGVIVEDAHRGRGIGGRLLREVAVEATARRHRALLCHTQPDNRPVLATVRRIGLPHTLAESDGVLTVTMRL